MQTAKPCLRLFKRDQVTGLQLLQEAYERVVRKNEIKRASVA